MINYKNGKIYRIINTQNETVYIGSTCQSLSQRLATHTHKGNGNKIILIENYPCDCCEELRMREQAVIEEHDGLLNMVRAYTSPEQQKEQKCEWGREYRGKNKEKISEWGREYREKNKEKISEKKREYNEKNKEKISEQNHQWYEKNKEKISEKQKEKVICEFCGSKLRKDYLKKHQREAKKCLAHQH